MKYLIACDLDGTLLNNEHMIGPKTVETLRQLANMGHLVVITTGRPYHAAIDFYNQLNINAPFITDNGGSIEHPTDKSFKGFSETIPLKTMHDLFKKVEPVISSAIYTSNGTAYAYKYQRQLEWLFNGAYANRLVEKNFDELDVHAAGIVFLIENDNVSAFEKIVSNDFGSSLSFRNWGSDETYSIFEVYLKHISKALALKYVLNYYNMDETQLMAIGDGINDVEMIRYANHGIAMKNAVQEVKQVAKHTTKTDNHHYGAASFFQDFFNIK